MWQDKMSLEKTEQNNTFRSSIFRLFFVHLLHLKIISKIYLIENKEVTLLCKLNR